MLRPGNNGILKLFPEPCEVGIITRYFHHQVQTLKGGRHSMEKTKGIRSHNMPCDPNAHYVSSIATPLPGFPRRPVSKQLWKKSGYLASIKHWHGIIKLSTIVASQTV